MEDYCLKYYLNKKVLVVDSIPIFELTKIRYVDSFVEEIVDTHLIHKKPIKQNTLSLKIFCGGG